MVGLVLAWTLRKGVRSLKSKPQRTEKSEVEVGCQAVPDCVSFYAEVEVDNAIFEKTYDVVVAGAGVAGVAAALECARSGLKTALVEKTVTGGRVSDDGSGQYLSAFV